MADYDATRDIIADLIEPFTLSDAIPPELNKLRPKGSGIFKRLTLARRWRDASQFVEPGSRGHAKRSVENASVAVDPDKKLGPTHFAVLSIVGIVIGTGSLISPLLPLLAIVLGAVGIVFLEIIARRR